MTVMGLALMASCANKQTSALVTTPSTQYENTMVEIDLPCVDASTDDANYIRALGTARSVNQQSARKSAMDAAKDMAMSRLGGFVQGLSSSYARTVSGQAAQDKVQRIMEGEFFTLVEEMINTAQKVCEKMQQDRSDGNYISYIAIQIPIKTMFDKMDNALSHNEELEAVFNQEKFRETRDEQLKKMKEARDEHINNMR